MPGLRRVLVRPAAGAGLVEVLLALLLLSLATTALLRTRVVSSLRVETAMYHTQANAFAQELALTLRSQSSMHLAAMKEDEPWGKIPGCDKPCSLAGMDADYLQSWLARVRGSGMPAPGACATPVTGGFRLHFSWAASSNMPCAANRDGLAVQVTAALL